MRRFLLFFGLVYCAPIAYLLSNSYILPNFSRLAFADVVPSTLQKLTRHNSQWGHLIVLHAAYRDPRLRPYVPARELMELTARVRQFLVSVAHPSSALADDIRILDYATEGSGLREDLAALSPRESRGGSRGGSGGGAGSSFGSNGSEMGTHIRV